VFCEQVYILSSNDVLYEYLEKKAEYAPMGLKSLTQKRSSESGSKVPTTNVCV